MKWETVRNRNWSVCPLLVSGSQQSSRDEEALKQDLRHHLIQLHCFILARASDPMRHFHVRCKPRCWELLGRHQKIQRCKGLDYVGWQEWKSECATILCNETTLRNACLVKRAIGWNLSGCWAWNREGSLFACFERLVTSELNWVVVEGRIMFLYFSKYYVVRIVSSFPHKYSSNQCFLLE